MPNVTSVQVNPINVESMTIPILGTSPLIQNVFSEKSKREILQKQMGLKTAKKREKKNPKQDFERSLHILKKGKFDYSKGNDDIKFTGEIGFPAGGIKSAIVAAARNVDGLAMTLLRGALFVVGDEKNPELVKVNYKRLAMREDIVRVGNNVPDIRFRGELHDWSINLKLQFNRDILNPEQIANLVNIAGFSVGLGEMRPGKSGGMNGRFKVKGTD